MPVASPQRLTVLPRAGLISPWHGRADVPGERHPRFFHEAHFMMQDTELPLLGPRYVHTTPCTAALLRADCQQGITPRTPQPSIRLATERVSCQWGCPGPPFQSPAVPNCAACSICPASISSLLSHAARGSNVTTPQDGTLL